MRRTNCNMANDSLISQSVLGPDASLAPPVADKEEATPAYRKFGDTPGTRKRLFANALAAAQAIEPVSNPRHTLALTDVAYHGPESFSIAEQKKAILSRKSLSRPLRGTWVLSDAEGAELGRKKATVAKIPWMTDRGTFVVNGNEYTMAHQMRLRPGVFTRMKDNGELESHVNVKKGFSHRIFLDPQSGIFRIQMGQARMPLLPLLRAQGVTDTQLREAWGNDLTYTNAQKDDPAVIRKLHSKLFKDGEGSSIEQKARVAEAFHNSLCVTLRALPSRSANKSSGPIMDW